MSSQDFTSSGTQNQAMIMLDSLVNSHGTWAFGYSQRVPSLVDDKTFHRWCSYRKVLSHRTCVPAPERFPNGALFDCDCAALDRPHWSDLQMYSGRTFSYPRWNLVHSITRVPVKEHSYSPWRDRASPDDLDLLASSYSTYAVGQCERSTRTGCTLYNHVSCHPRFTRPSST